MKNRAWVIWVVAAAALAGCAPRTENTAVSALKKEKNAWERESDTTAQDATQAAENAVEESNKETDATQ